MFREYEHARIPQQHKLVKPQKANSQGNSVVNDSKSVAAQELKAAVGSDVTVSCDGTYHRRGFQSKNGVVSVLSVNGKNSKVIRVKSL